MGVSGNSQIDVEVRRAVSVWVFVFTCHCFMWFVQFGGKVIVEWYARRR